MNKVVKRIRISHQVDELMNKLNIHKQRYIEMAILEKLRKEYRKEFKILFNL